MQQLFEAFGPHDSIGYMDYGLVVYDWLGRSAGVRAWVQDEVCKSIEVYERG